MKLLVGIAGLLELLFCSGTDKSLEPLKYTTSFVTKVLLAKNAPYSTFQYWESFTGVGLFFRELAGGPPKVRSRNLFPFLSGPLPEMLCLEVPWPLLFCDERPPELRVRHQLPQLKEFLRHS